MLIESRFNMQGHVAFSDLSNHSSANTYLDDKQHDVRSIIFLE